MDVLYHGSQVAGKAIPSKCHTATPFSSGNFEAHGLRFASGVNAKQRNIEGCSLLRNDPPSTYHSEELTSVVDSMAYFFEGLLEGRYNLMVGATFIGRNDNRPAAVRIKDLLCVGLLRLAAFLWLPFLGMAGYALVC